jgi:hypothetical protein
MPCRADVLYAKARLHPAGSSEYARFGVDDVLANWGCFVISHPKLATRLLRFWRRDLDCRWPWLTLHFEKWPKDWSAHKKEHDIKNKENMPAAGRGWNGDEPFGFTDGTNDGACGGS